MSRQEHITSDIGSVGDFAAGSEVAFGTILQRTYSVLGARMHYGHPDIMNKQPLGVYLRTIQKYMRNIKHMYKKTYVQEDIYIYIYIHIYIYIYMYKQKIYI